MCRLASIALWAAKRIRVLNLHAAVLTTGATLSILTHFVFTVQYSKFLFSIQISVQISVQVHVQYFKLQGSCSV